MGAGLVVAGVDRRRCFCGAGEWMLRRGNAAQQRFLRRSRGIPPELIHHAAGAAAPGRHCNNTAVASNLYQQGDDVGRFGGGGWHRMERWCERDLVIVNATKGKGQELCNTSYRPRRGGFVMECHQLEKKMKRCCHDDASGKGEAFTVLPVSSYCTVNLSGEGRWNSLNADVFLTIAPCVALC